jgi:putative redox protein
MPSNAVRVNWLEGQSFLLRDRAGFPIVMAQPLGVNGADLLPLSLIGCSSWDVMSDLQSRGLAVTDLQVTAEYEQDDAPPWRFRSIRILYCFTGTNLDPEQIRNAIELSETRYCSIYATLRDAVELSSDFKIVPDQQEMKQPG